MPDPKPEFSRVEQAHAEVGHTAISRGTTWALVGLFLATVVAVPLVQHVHEFARTFEATRPQCCTILGALPEAAATFREGSGSLVRRVLAANSTLLRRINEYEDQLEDEAVLRAVLLPPTQSVMTGWLGVGNEEAYCGRDGWLFFRAGVDHLTGPGFLDPRQLARRAASGNEWTPAPQPDPVKAIADFHRQLAARGIDLIVVPVPVKAAIHPTRLSARANGNGPPLRNASWGAFAEGLEAEGVKLYDPTPLLREMDGDQYLATDTHWTPDAVVGVARDLAAFIRANCTLPTNRVPYLRREAEVEHLGDIAVMLNLPKGQRLYHPQTVSIQQVRTPDGVLWQPSRDADVLVLGDSFSNIYSLGGLGWGKGAGLVEQLSAELGRPMDRIVRNAGGAHATRQQLRHELRRGDDRLAGKRLVIYPFATRELSGGDWRLLDLALGTSPARLPEFPPGRIIVRGTVAAVAPVPKPGTVTYRECITAIHLTGVAATRGQLDADEILVFVWGMRDNRWTPAARYRKGQPLVLRLAPWGDVEPKLGRYNRIEVDDDDVLLLDTFWGETEP